MQEAFVYEIAVVVDGIDAETVADIFRQKCESGVVIEPSSRLDTSIDAWVVDGDGSATVRGYMPADADVEAIAEALHLAVQMAPLGSPAGWQPVRRIEEESWRDAWKKHFGVQRIGKALVIKPSWATYTVRAGDTVIEIDPGMAFGTGQHPTTAMCLRALEEHVRPWASVLDLGCGSGILAIAAAKLGATRVLAIDNDPQAIKATSENAGANGVLGVVEPREGTLDEAGERFDVIVANISGLTLSRLAPLLFASLKPGGALIASGFLGDTVASVSEAFAAAGFTEQAVIEDGAWRAIVAQR